VMRGRGTRRGAEVAARTSAVWPKLREAAGRRASSGAASARAAALARAAGCVVTSLCLGPLAGQ